MSHGERWNMSRHKPRFAGPPPKEHKTDGEVFVEHRHTRQVRALLYNVGRELGFRGRQLVKYVEHQLEGQGFRHSYSEE